MPQAIAVDREQVRIVAVQVGVREAARQFELSEDTVKTWSARYGWFDTVEEQKQLVEQARQTLRVKQGMKPTETSAAEILKEYGGNTRLKLAKGLSKAADVVADMDGQEVLLSAQQVSHVAKSAALIHGWESAVNSVNLRLDIIAGQAPELPCIDITPEEC